MATARQDAFLGVVFFVAIGLLLAATLMLSNFSFRERPELQVLFANAAGLDKGDAVYVLGRRVGEVSEVAPRAGAAAERIAVRLLLDEPLQLHADARIEIVDVSLLGGKRVEIEPGLSDALLPADTSLRGVVRKSPIDALGDEMQGEDSLVGGLKTAVGKLNGGEGTLAQLFNSPKLHDALLSAVESLTVSLKAIETGQGAIGRFIHDPKVGADLAEAVANARSFTQKLDSGDGLVGAILNDATLAGNVRTLLGDLAHVSSDLREGRGAVGLLLRDGDTRARVQAFLSDLPELTSLAKNPEAGLMGALLADSQMASDARSTLSSLRDFADNAAHGDGLLARLANDADWGRRVGQILGQVQRAVEDAREAAPVGTFFQVLTGFF
ncbi:MAG: MlaD family protein [Planctomycetota bacterium]